MYSLFSRYFTSCELLSIHIFFQFCSFGFPITNIHALSDPAMGSETV